MHAPLAGLDVVELAGIGPGPHAAMVLADLGASVTRVVRPGDTAGGNDHVLRGRHFVTLDLKSTTGREQLLERVCAADVLIEGFRPGVTERLGVGPTTCLAANPGLVYARMTGWGQDGPMAHNAGHDINYLALTGALAAIGTTDQPIPPLNLVGDYGGGSMFLITGILSALWARTSTGQGRIVDAAMVDGAAVLTQQVLELRAQDAWGPGGRQANLLDGGAPFYRTYACRDGGHVAVGAIESQFYALVLDGLGLDSADLPAQMDHAGWPELAKILAERFAAQDRDHWERVFTGTDACVTPVLDFTEAAQHPHIVFRGSLIDKNGELTAGVAPRFAHPTNSEDQTS